jgi:hypothetical protein
MGFVISSGGNTPSRYSAYRHRIAMNCHSLSLRDQSTVVARNRSILDPKAANEPDRISVRIGNR